MRQNRSERLHAENNTALHHMKRMAMHRNMQKDSTASHETHAGTAPAAMSARQWHKTPPLVRLVAKYLDDEEDK